MTRMIRIDNSVDISARHPGMDTALPDSRKSPFLFLVQGESMIPTLRPGDLIVAGNTQKLKRGDIVLFLHSRYHRIVIHRIDAVTGDYCTTRGDHNPPGIQECVPLDHIIGKMVLRIPWIGNIISLLRNYCT